MHDFPQFSGLLFLQDYTFLQDDSFLVVYETLHCVIETSESIGPNAISLN